MNQCHTPHLTRNSCGLCCTQIEDFGVQIGNDAIIHDINMHIHCGELTALIGPNGGGKSTLLKAIIGDLPHTGRLNYLDSKGLHTGKPILGYIPQKIDFDRNAPVSVLDFLSSCLSGYPIWLGYKKQVTASILANLEKVQATHLIHRRLGDLSGGELQRVMLALALHPVPDILLLDEPIAGVDAGGMQLFYDLVSELRISYDLTVLLVSHDLDTIAKYADNVILLNKTVITAGKPVDVFQHRQFLESFGLDILTHIDALSRNVPQDLSCASPNVQQDSSCNPRDKSRGTCILPSDSPPLNGNQ